MTLFRAHNTTTTMGSTKIVAKILFSLLIASLLMVCANSDDAKDKEECTQQLVGLATCLPYVEGNAKAPTPDCCSGLKQVLKSNKKCLCVVIKHRNDPDLGLTVNVTLALGLPTVCSAPANVTKCPELLHLPPNSPDAQVFYQFGHNSSNSATSPASSPITTVTSTSPSTSAQQKSEGCQIGKRWFGLEATVVVAFIWCFFTSNSII